MTNASVSELFPIDTWEDRRSAVAHGDNTFVSADMLVTLLFADSAAQAADRFPEAQQDIKNYRATIEKAPDCYLLMISPWLTEEDYELVRRALDDTLVCRKIIIPLEGMPVADAIRRHFPLVSPPTAASESAQEHVSEAGGPSDDDLELLDKQSAKNIAEQLIDRARAHLQEKG